VTEEEQIERRSSDCSQKPPCLELPDGGGLVTHLRVHLLTGEDAAGGGARAHGPKLPVALGTE